MTTTTLMPPPSFLYGLVAGFAGYFTCRRIAPLLTSLGTKSFKHQIASLDEAQRYRYHNWLCSTVHALVQIIGTYSFVLYGREGYDDDDDDNNTLPDGGTSSPAIVFDDRIFVPYGTTHLGPTVYMGIFVGYLIGDALGAPAFGNDGMEYPFVVHHIAASACWTFCACNRIMQPVAYLFQFNEISTPLMNVRQYLLTAGYKGSDPPVLFFTLSFFVTFAGARVAPLPWIVRDWIVRDFDAIRERLGVGSAILLTAFFAVNGLLQCGWFFIMCQRLVGMVTPKKIEPKKKAV